MAAPPSSPTLPSAAVAPAPLRETALAWLRAGMPAVVVEVEQAEGSVPREAGTRMLVAANAVAGTIGGGHLELKAIESARALLAGDDRVPRRQRFALGPALGQCCGGALVLALRPLAQTSAADWPPPAPRFHLQLYGAGHVGRAIAALLDRIEGCRAQWIDERAEQFPAAPSAPHVERVCVEPVQAEVAHAPPGAYYLVLTHSHDLDLAITGEVLARGDFGWLGLIGSKTKRARFVHRFEQRGVPSALLERLVCPIGIAGIAGKEPEVIAVAVVAQLLRESGAGAKAR